MVGLSQRNLAGDKLRAACAAELARLNLTTEGVLTASDDCGGWSVMANVQGRTFHFGTMGGNGYFFVEMTDGRENDHTAPLPPGAQDFRTLWPYSFALLKRAIMAPDARGFEPPIY